MKKWLSVLIVFVMIAGVRSLSGYAAYEQAITINANEFVNTVDCFFSIEPWNMQRGNESYYVENTYIMMYGGGWTEYDVEVPVSGYYKVSARVCNEDTVNNPNGSGY